MDNQSSTNRSGGSALESTESRAGDARPGNGASVRSRSLALLAGVLGLGFLLLPGCDGEDGGPMEPDPGPTVESVQVSPGQSEIFSGESRQLEATPVDAQGNEVTDVAVSWSSSDEAVATVDMSGLVTAQGGGSALITATAGDASGEAAVEVPTPDGTAEPGSAVTVEGGQGDVTLEVPEGAVSEETDITIADAPSDSLPTGDANAGLVDGTAHDFAPDGLDFSESATLTIAYDEGSVPDGFAEDALRIQRRVSGGWQVVDGGSVDTEANTATAPIDGFSIYGVVGLENRAPTVTIDQPSDGATFAPGTEITFAGSASDPEDGELAGESLVWESDQDGQFGTGAEVTTSGLSEGEHTITLTATDSDGAEGSASITIEITAEANDPPAADIESPADGAEFVGAAPIPFEGTGTDPQDGDLAGESLVWESSIDGQIGTGQSFTNNQLTGGDHTITLTATDAQGATGTDQVQITVIPNVQPAVTISGPADGAEFAEGASITFTGSATDEEDGELTGSSLVWESDVDGELGTGGSVTTTLSVAVHTITLTATDSDGGVGSASITIVVGNPPPSAEITAPGDGTFVQEGTTLTFQGSGSDPEEGALTGASLVWESDIDGQIGTGETFDATLSPGSHTVTLTVTDGEGATATDEIAVTVNGQPSASISSPTDAATFFEGEPITFTGSGSDPEDGTLTGASLVWESDLDGQIGTGETFDRDDLSVGDHTVTLTASDGDGGTATASVTITVMVNDPPTATIDQPADGAVVQEGATTTFQGSGSDPEDGALTGASLVWSSDQDGQFGTGESVDATLTPGQHTVTLTATDSRGATGSASIGVRVNEQPSATISAPADGSTFQPDETVSFQGSGSDPEDGSLSGSSLVWSSDLDGELGTGETLDVSSLSSGDHTITLTATDSDGGTGTATIQITVSGGPSVTISSPADGAAFETGASVTFEGSATDPEDGALTGSSLVWDSDIDAQIGTGETVTTSSLSAGTHTITLTATDSDGRTGTASIEVTINEPPTATISAPADGATFDEGESVTFQGSGSDPEDGALTGSSLVWESDVDGQIGTGESVSTASLTAGATSTTHAITLTATDADGATGTDQISVTIEALGSVSGSVTRSNDGAGLGGIGVELLDSGGSTVATTTTDGSGAYSFADLSAGDYTVEVVQADFPKFGSFQTATSQAVTVNPGGSITADFAFRVPEIDLIASLSSGTVNVGDQPTVTVTVSYDGTVITEPLSGGSGDVGWDTAVVTSVGGSGAIGPDWGSGLVNATNADRATWSVVSASGTSANPVTMMTVDVSADAAGTTQVTPSVSELQTINNTTGETTELTDFVIVNVTAPTLTVQ